MRRYIITGAPGAGKTTILAALRARGYAVVDEAATDVNVHLQAPGRDEAWRDPGFIDAITLLQRERLEQPAPPATRSVRLSRARLWRGRRQLTATYQGFWRLPRS